MYQRILFSTDGSPFAEEALGEAIGLAKLASGHLRIVSVIESPAFHGTPEAMMLYETEMYRSLHAELEKLARGAVERAVAAAGDAGVRVSSTIRSGLPADEILAEAADWDADCIVLATHGRSGLGRLLLGSVASRVLQHARCPVLLHRSRKSDDTHR